MDTLTSEDRKDFKAAEVAIERLMLDGAWHSASEIIGTAEQREGLRRLRSLRSKYAIRKRRSADGSREFYYQLAPKGDEPIQLNLNFR